MLYTNSFIKHRLEIYKLHVFFHTSIVTKYNLSHYFFASLPFCQEERNLKKFKLFCDLELCKLPSGFLVRMLKKSIRL